MNCFATEATKIKRDGDTPLRHLPKTDTLCNQRLQFIRRLTAWLTPQVGRRLVRAAAAFCSIRASGGPIRVVRITNANDWQEPPFAE